MTMTPEQTEALVKRAWNPPQDVDGAHELLADLASALGSLRAENEALVEALELARAYTHTNYSPDARTRAADMGAIDAALAAMKQGGG